MRQAIGIAAALLLLTGCGADAPKADESPKPKTEPTASATPSATPTPTVTPTATTTTTTPTPTPKPSPTVSWDLALNEAGKCGPYSGDDCVAKPSLGSVPPLGKNAAMLRVRGMWKADLTVPRSLGDAYVTCEKFESPSFEVDDWVFTIRSHKENDGPYGLQDDSAWLELTVTDNGRTGDYSAEAVLSFDNDGHPLEVSDTTETLQHGESVLLWDWSPDRRTVRFSYRAPSATSVGGVGPVDLIGSTLVSGALRCPTRR